MSAEDSVVVFRADGSSHIGSGHVVRCVTLATELARRGAHPLFVCRRASDAISQPIVDAGFELAWLPAGAHRPARNADDYGGWLGVPEAHDAVETIRVLDGRRPRWIVADHYGLGLDWHRVMRPHAGGIAVIDDLANRSHDCDVLVDQNYLASESEGRYAQHVPSGCTTLLGPRYALLHATYRRLHQRPRDANGVMRRVIVFFGASDATNETAKVLMAMEAPALRDIQVDAVLGEHHPDPDELLRIADSRGRVTLHRRLASLADLTAAADLAIGAAGTSTWERLCLGVPSIVVTLAPNQVPSARALARDGYVRWLGCAPLVTAAQYAHAITHACERPREVLPPLVDGRGAERVAERLLPSSAAALRIRPATPADAELFFDWRNDPLARRMSFSNDAVTWDAHRRWFSDRVHDGTCTLRVAEVHGLPVGQYRIEWRGPLGTVSYSVDAVARGRGWGEWLVRQAIDDARTRGARLRAEVKFENTASLRIFRTLRFAEATAEGKVIFTWQS